MTAGVATTAVILFGGNSIATTNTFYELASNAGLARSVTNTFGVNRIKKNVTFVNPCYSNATKIAWQSIIGSTVWYHERWYPCISIENSGMLKLEKFDQTWDGSWTNTGDVTGVPGDNSGSGLRNYFSLISYNKRSHYQEQTVVPKLQYIKDEPHNTWAGMTQAFCYNIADGTYVDVSNPVSLFAERVVIGNHGGYNVTNPEDITVSWDNGSQSRRFGYSTKFIDSYNPIIQYPRPSSDSVKGLWVKAVTNVSCIISAMDTGSGLSSDHFGLYVPQGSTSVNFEVSSPPPDSYKSTHIAQEWMENVLSSSGPIVNFNGSNVIPQTYYDSAAEITADNLKGTVTIKVNSGVQFDRNNLVRRGDLANNVYQYVGRRKNIQELTVSGFLKVKPTKLRSRVDVNNNFIQPEYVSYNDIKKIIASQGIIGSVPKGFDLDNIDIYSIQRFNSTGSIQVKVGLNYYYDGKGDIKTSGFSPSTMIISGFAVTGPSILPSRISVPGVNDVLATDVSPDQIKKYIYNYIKDNGEIWRPGNDGDDFIFPPNFSAEDIIIKNQNIVANNKSGSIRVSVNCKNYYDGNGQISNDEETIGIVNLTGFMSIAQTVFGSTSFDYPPDGKYPTDLLAEPNLIKDFIGSQFPSFAIPKNFNAQRDIQLTNIAANNPTGRLTFTATLNNYYDANGMIRNTGFKPTVVTINFSQSVNETILPDQVDVNTKFKYGDIPVFDFDEEAIKDMVSKSFTDPPPLGFTTKNIKFASQPIYNGKAKTIKVTPILDYWADGDGNIRQEPKEFREITFFNFKGSPTTKFKDADDLLTLGDGVTIASDVAKNLTKAKTLVMKGLVKSTIPEGFSINNIELSNFNINNGDGVFSVDVDLNYWYDANGAPSNTGWKTQNVTIGTFGYAPDPTSLPAYFVGDNTRLAQSYLEKELKQIVLDNMVSPVPGTNLTNIELRNLTYDYVNGRISFIPTINLWYGSDLSIHTEPKEFPQFVIGDLKTTTQTLINTDDLATLSNPDMYPSAFATDTKSLIDLVDGLITVGRPEEFNPYNDIVLSDIVTDDRAGTLQIGITLTNYFDEDGVLRNDNFKKQTIVISGFKTVSGATTIDNDVFVQEPYTTMYPFEINPLQVRQLIFDNLKNKIPNMSINNVTLYNGYSVNNIAGTITTIPYVNSYYDDAGQIVPNAKQLNQVTFRGFKNSIGETRMVQTDWIGNPDELAETAAKDIPALKQLVLEHLINATERTVKNPAAYVEIKNLVYDNISSTITISVVLKEKYDANGEVISGNFDMGSVTITGYKPSLGYTSIPNRIPTINTRVYASDMSVDDIKDMLRRSISNAPSELTMAGIHIKDNNLKINNALGTIKFVPILDWSYDVYGNLINVPKEYGEVTIYGFLNASKTSIPVTSLSAKTQPILSNGDMYPNELQHNLHLLKQLMMSLIQNPPPGFGPEYIQISNVQADNYSGSLTFNVALGYFWDNNGIALYNGFIPVTISISDLKTAPGVTSVLKIINVSSASSTPGDVTDDEIKNELFANFFSLPDGIKASDITFKVPPVRNNLDGSISVIPILPKAYNSTTNLVNKPTEFPEVRLTGYLTTSPTILNTTEVPATHPVLPSVLAADVDELKKIVYKTLVSRPPLFTANNVLIDPTNIQADNLNGTLTFQFTLNQFYDSDGILKTSGFKPKWMKITRLISVTPTKEIIEKVQVGGVDNLTPTISNFPDSKVFNFIKTNLTTSIVTDAPDLDVDRDIKISVTSRNFLDGEINARLEFMKYYNNSGQVVVVKSGEKGKIIDVTLKGFKATAPTSFVSEFAVPNESDSLAQNVVGDTSLLASIVYNNIESIINNPPADLSISDIVLNSNSIKAYDNEKGTIDVQIGLKNYYNQNGQQIILPTDSDPQVLSRIVKLSGFKTTKATTITNNLVVNNYESYIPGQINDSILQTIVNNNSTAIFSRLPSLNSLDGNLEVSRVTYDNIVGTVTANIKIYEYYNDEGYLVSRLNDSPKEQQIVLSGFKKVGGTIIQPTLELRGQENNLASSFSDANVLKEIIFPQIDQLIQNKPASFIPQNSLNIDIVNVDNIKGEIETQISLSNYINDQGEVVSAANEHDYLTKTVTITGFKKVKSTTINTHVYVPNVKSIDTLLINEAQLTKIVADNKNLFFNHLPDEFNINYLKVNILSVNQNAGTIYATIATSCYYDEYDNLVIDVNNTYSVDCEITGFKSYLSANTSIDNIIAVGTIAGVMTIILVGALAISFKMNKRKLKV